MADRSSLDGSSVTPPVSPVVSGSVSCSIGPSRAIDPSLNAPLSHVRCEVPAFPGQAERTFGRITTNLIFPNVPMYNWHKRKASMPWPNSSEKSRRSRKREPRRSLRGLQTQNRAIRDPDVQRDPIETPARPTPNENLTHEVARATIGPTELHTKPGSIP